MCSSDLRSMIRPGVTGWAQVRYGYANNLEEETEKMRYDLYYIMRRSILLDARILLDTARVVLLGHGAETAGEATSAARAYDRAFTLLPHLLLRRDSGRAVATQNAPVAFSLTGDFKNHAGRGAS